MVNTLKVGEESEIVFELLIVRFLGKQPWGSDSGQKAFVNLNRIVRDRPERIVNLNLRGIERIDASCSREALCNLIRHYQGHRCFFLSGIANASIRENIDSAFARREMTVIHRLPSEDYEILGMALRAHLLQTLETLETLGATTSNQVCKMIKGLKLTACNNRLKDLSDQGLLARVEQAAASGGKEFFYLPVR